MNVVLTSGTPRAVLLTALLLAAVASSAQQRGIDCRKFVFAPICRGVAAKRSDNSIMRSILHLTPSQRVGGGEILQPGGPDVTPELRQPASSEEPRTETDDESEAERESRRERELEQRARHLQTIRQRTRDRTLERSRSALQAALSLRQFLGRQPHAAPPVDYVEY